MQGLTPVPISPEHSNRQSRAVSMLVLLEIDRVDIAAAIKRYAGGEGMRLRDFVNGHKIAATFGHGEDLPRTPRPSAGGGWRRNCLRCSPQMYSVARRLVRQRLVAARW